MRKIQERLSYANVVATLALFLALGGVGYAASQLPKNSVGTKQLKKSAVTGAKVKKQTLTGKNINLAKLGTVPSATSATTASALTALEAVHAVGAAGEPPFLDGTITRPPENGVTFPPVWLLQGPRGHRPSTGVGDGRQRRKPQRGHVVLAAGRLPAGAGDLADLSERRRRGRDFCPRHGREQRRQRPFWRRLRDGR